MRPGRKRPSVPQKKNFLLLLEKARTLDEKVQEEFIAARDYEGLDAYILRHLMGADAGKGKKKQQPERK